MKNDEPYLLVNDSRPVPAELRGAQRVPTYTCAHCRSLVVLNPTRRRERAFCKRCEYWICDDCHARRVAVADERVGCRAFKHVIDEVQVRAWRTQERAVKIASPIILAGAVR